MSQRFEFAFAPAYLLPAVIFGVRPGRARVEIDGDLLRVSFGRWRLVTPVDNVASTQETGPFRYLKTAGPAHLSLKDRGVTFATNGRRGVCVAFREPVAALDPSGRLRHPAMTVTVARPELLIDALPPGGGPQDQPKGE